MMITIKLNACFVLSEKLLFFASYAGLYFELIYLYEILPYYDLHFNNSSALLHSINNGFNVVFYGSF